MKDKQGRRRLPRATALALSALASVVLAACGSSTRALSGTVAPAISTPLATSIQTTAGTWATVAMGRLDQPLNTFWQLLFRPAGGASWSDRVEATAVATNGGLVLTSPRGRGVLVGVRPTNLLTFSPLIFSADAGRSWSTGLLSAGLAARPDALAASSASDLLALVNARAGAQVLSSTSGPSGWRASITARALSSTPAGRSCGLAAITAVAYMAQAPLIGASCSRPGVVGVFVASGAGWRLLDAAPPSSLSPHARIEVLALQAEGDGAGALLVGSEAGAMDLVAAWYRDGHWSGSQPLSVSASQHISSFGPASGSGIFVLLGASSGPTRLAVASGPGDGWLQLAPPPAGTATVAFGPGSRVEALAVRETVLDVWSLTAPSRDWVRRQTLRVPIEFGSSE